MAVLEMAAVRSEPVSLDWARRAWGELEGLALLREALTGPLAGRIAMVSSFGAESAVLLDMVASVDRRTPVIFLETGKLFAETLRFKDELVAWLRLEDVRAIRPSRDRPRPVRSRRNAVAERARPLLPHSQDRAARRGLGRLRRLDHRAQAFPGRCARPRCRRSRAIRSPARSSSIPWRAGRRKTSGTTGACASCRCIPWLPEAIRRSVASPAPVLLADGEDQRAGRWCSSTRPSAASTAARASETVEGSGRTASDAMRPDRDVGRSDRNRRASR